MKKIKVGIVGLGRIGKMHAENLVSMQKYEVIVGADPFLTEELEVELKDIGVPYCTCNPEEVFTNPDIDAVVICSTTDTHSDSSSVRPRQEKISFAKNRLIMM